MSDNPVIKDDELILRTAAAATAVVTGTGKQIGPCGLVKAVVNVTALATSGTLAISIQGGLTLGGTYYDLVIFPVISAVGVYEATFRSPDYGFIRYETTAVHSTESITYDIYVTTVEK
jgi:hypothetical protein